MISSVQNQNGKFTHKKHNVLIVRYTDKVENNAKIAVWIFVGAVKRLNIINFVKANSMNITVSNNFA